MSIGANSMITFDSTGQSDQQTDPAAVVKEKIKFILSVNKGEIPNDPNYGADLQQFCHSNNDDTLAAGIDMVVKAEIGLRMNFVRIRSVEIDQVTESGSVYFTVYYELTDGWEDFVQIEVPAA